MLRVCGYRTIPKDKDVVVVNTTSRSNNWSQGLSPFLLGPVNLYDIYVARNVENAWQYSKVYPQHLDADGNPSEDYFVWAQWGWNKNTADRYPMGKGAKPAFSYWDGLKLTYVEARRKIYAPVYAGAVEKSEAFQKLKTMYKEGQNIVLLDFDGYDHKKLNMSYEDVMNCDTKKMGHAFVIAMLLENERIWDTPLKT